MSTAFKEFLHKNAKKYHDGKAIVEEWRSAIERLFTEIRQWLKESDTDGIMEIEQTEQVVNEPGIGRYRVPRLNLGVLGKWIGIIPKARINAGSAKPPRKSVPERADGRIDITDDVRRYVLYRFREGDHYEWFIETPNQSISVNSEPGPFNKEAFENALMSYLR